MRERSSLGWLMLVVATSIAGCGGGDGTGADGAPTDDAMSGGGSSAGGSSSSVGGAAAHAGAAGHAGSSGGSGHSGGAAGSGAHAGSGGTVGGAAGKGNTGGVGGAHPAGAGGGTSHGGTSGGGINGVGGTSAGGTSGVGGTSAGGTNGVGGTSAGGTNGVGGTSAGGTNGVGGTSAGGTNGVGGTSSGGTSGLGGASVGGTNGAGGTSSGGASVGGTNGAGGTSSGGASVGGASVGGTNGAGGTSGGGTSGLGGASVGGTNGVGGTSNGGANSGAGGSSNGGASTGGSAGVSTAGSGGASVCAQASDCDDGVFCNGAEDCVSQKCVSGTLPTCADLVPCTTDFCDESAKSCANQPTDAACPSDVCKGTATCDALSGCGYTGQPLSCDDGLACTTDACDAKSGCTHTPNDSLCQDGTLCNGVEACVVGVGCTAGVAPKCDDGIACTADSCDAILGCTNVPQDIACDDGKVCDGTETCDPFKSGADPKTGCVSGSGVTCLPSVISCLDVACSELTKGCVYTPDSAKCTPGHFCDPVLGCVLGKQCQNAAQCDDGDPCNGAETCNTGVCQGASPISCDDGLGCTADSCTKNVGCVHAPVDAVCDDGDPCNGTEGCSVGTGCGPKAPAPNCADAFSCTIDYCQAFSGCVHEPTGSLCDDNNVCNGSETCAPGAPGANGTTGCVAGSAPSCDDQISCTVDSCDKILGCSHIPDSTLCPLNLDCVPSKGGCVNQCVVTKCQNHVYECGDCIDNDGDGLIDSHDPQCLGACDNTEDSLYGGIPGQNNAPCKQDCYFDADSGAGNDNCYWDHRCDPLEVAPNYTPESNQCAYDPSKVKTLGNGDTCIEAQTGVPGQTAQCNNYCGPLTPNGCDCFGCCEIPSGGGKFVWLGSVDGSGKNGTCTLDKVSDPAACHPCTPVQGACYNPCEHCEICIGKPTLPPDCQVQSCPVGKDPCGLSGQAACGTGLYCVSGCCQPVAN